MRIAIVAPEFPPEKGGIQTYSHEFVLALTRRGHEVTVFTQAHDGGELRDAPFAIEPVLGLRRRLDRVILRGKKFDVWHTTNAAYAWLALETPRAFVTVHGNDFLRPYFPVGRLDLPSRWRLPFGSNLDRWLGDQFTEALVNRGFARAAHVFTNSRFTEQAFLRKHPACRGRTSAAMVGVAARFLAKARPPRPAGPPRLITVCRLAEPHKNVDLVLRALSRLRNSFDFCYTIVGDGYLRPELEQLTHELELEDRVHFTGFLETETLHDLLLTHDLFVLTTSETPVAYEGFGLVYLEAAACGCPVLAARIAGATEAVDEGRSGLFVEQVTVESVEASLRRFLTGEVAFDPADCIEFARRFTWEAVADHCLARYEAAG